MRGLEGDIYTAAYVEANGERFALAIPNGWQAGAAAQTNALLLNMRTGELPITIAFSAQDALPLLTNAEALRLTVVPFLNEATVLEEFPAYSGYSPGRGMDFSFVLHGQNMMARVAVIPLAHGFASFYVAGSAEQKAVFLRALGTSLTSFRSSPPNAREESGTLGFQSQKAERPKTRIASSAQSFDVLHTAPPAPPKPVPVHKSIFEGQEDRIRLGLVSVLMVVLVSRTLARQRQEAEIRALQGGYLSDGTAIASFNMPDLFAPAPEVPGSPWSVPTRVGLVGEVPGQMAMTRMEEFLEQAPTYLAGLRKAIQKLGQAGSEAEWCEALLELPSHVTALREKANFWEARPVWQMSSALELLIQRLAEKPKDATPSTLLTIRAAADMLHALCVPGIRPNLLIDPPIQVLAVDDDALCLRAMVFALQKASLTADVANDGKQSLALASKKVYDIIFMDIQMPEMDGLTACQKIRETTLNAETPVVFVTIQSDFHTRAQSNILGGSDFMAKPFLIFELTVKALMFTMRKRLGMCSPSKVAVVSESVGAPQAEMVVATAPVVATPFTESGLAVTPAPVKTFPISVTELTGDFFSAVPEYLAATRRIVDELRIVADPGSAPEAMCALFFRVHEIASGAERAKLTVASHVSSTLEALVKRLHGNPKIVTTSTLNTVSKALLQLEALCVPGVEAKLADHPPVRILVVDDEPLARRAVVGALQLTFKKPQSAHDGTTAAALATNNPYDVIFTDVQMPDIDGFELCRAIRDGGINADTPVVFITNHTDVESQALAAACGGNDFIGKPFLPIEITVKALTFAWDCRLRKINGRATAILPPEIQSQVAALGDSPALSHDPVACRAACAGGAESQIT